jgi:hypothetical protein
VGRRSAENGAARLSVSGPSRSASKLVYPGCAYLAPSRHRILSVECLLLCRFSAAGNNETLPALKRPAAEKRQGTKSREVGH